MLPSPQGPWQSQKGAPQDRKDAKPLALRKVLFGFGFCEAENARIEKLLGYHREIDPAHRALVLWSTQPGSGTFSPPLLMDSIC